MTPPTHPEESEEEAELSAPFLDVHLWRYVLATDTATDLTPTGGVLGVLGASEDGTYVYYATKHTFYNPGGVFLWHSGVVTPVAASVASDSYPPTTGTARVSADGRHLLFVSSAFELTGYDSRNIGTGKPDPEVYLFTAPGSINSGNVCVSCNPFGERPVGAASLPGASPNGAERPRLLQAPRDLGGLEAGLLRHLRRARLPGHQRSQRRLRVGGTRRRELRQAEGCVSLISSGRAENGASFLDASVDGSDAFFLTDGSLVPSDPGAYDVYDARVGGGYPLPPNPVPCFGDTCQPLPPEPEDPTPGTQRSKATGNLPTPPHKKPLKCKKSQLKRFGKCVAKKTHKKTGETPMRALRLNRLCGRAGRAGPLRPVAGAERRPGRLRLPPRSRRLPRQRDLRRRRAGRDPGRLPSLLAGHRNQLQPDRRILRRRPQGPRNRPAGRD